MRAGQIVQIGTGEEILQDPANDYVAQFVQDVDRTRVLTASSVMEPARAVVIDTEGPRAVLRQMREEQAHSAFVVSRDRKLRGTIRDEAAQAVVSKGRDGLQEALNTEPVTVSADTLLADVFAPSAESPLPVAVVDEDNRLLGVIPRATLLGAMATLFSEPEHAGGLGAEDDQPPDPGGAKPDRPPADAMFEAGQGTGSGGGA
jgi:glycine betaine/proline transport system ATP-binding protein